MTSDEQHSLNRCYVEIMTALIELDSIQHKNTTLQRVQDSLRNIEDALHGFVKPVSKEEQ